MSIEVRGLSKRFGAFRALDEVSLHIETGELVALLGPSGCGKTTLLRIIAGLESADAGSVLFAGEDATEVDVRQRQVGFVFQHYALFKHMTVFENVAFGLRVRHRSQRPSEARIRAKVLDLLGLVQLDWLADRYPAQLSGGQRQRIALARALAVEPRVLLLDEPFGALDAKVRKELRRWLRRLHDELHVASVFVTHDQEEALEVTDRVVLMNAGRIERGLAARGLGAAGHAIRVRLPGRRQPAAWPCHARRVAPGRGGAAGAGPARGRQPARHRLCASARYRPGPRGHGRSRHPGAPEPRVPGRTQRLPRTGAPGRSGHHRGASA